MARKPSKHLKRRMAFLGPFSLFIILVTLYTIISTLYSINSLSKQKIALEDELDNLKNNQLILEEEVEKLKNPEYIAKYAREHYFYTKEGEYVIKYEEKKEKKTENINANVKDYASYGIYLSIIPILYFVFKIIKK